MMNVPVGQESDDDAAVVHAHVVGTPATHGVTTFTCTIGFAAGGNARRPYSTVSSIAPSVTYAACIASTVTGAPVCVNAGARPHMLITYVVLVNCGTATAAACAVVATLFNSASHSLTQNGMHVPATKDAGSTAVRATSAQASPQ